MTKWLGKIGHMDDFGNPIKEDFVDGKTIMGPWAIMSPKSHAQYGVGLGTGRGQHYRKQSDGSWLKVK